MLDAFHVTVGQSLESVFSGLTHAISWRFQLRIMAKSHPTYLPFDSQKQPLVTSVVALAKV